jgi:hypothetical protein
MLLRPRGFFYMQTPNFGSLMHRRYRADWYALATPRHLCLLTGPATRRLLQEVSPWSSLIVRSNPRRATREQEQTIAMRRKGSFEATPPFSRRDRMETAAWSLSPEARLRGPPGQLGGRARGERSVRQPVGCSLCRSRGGTGILAGTRIDILRARG